MRGALDRARHELRKEGHEEREVEEAVGGAEATAIDVDRVAHRLERVERDPDREHHVEMPVRGRNAEVPEKLLEASDEEVEVLEEPEHAEVHDEARHERSAAPGSLGKRRETPVARGGDDADRSDGQRRENAGARQNAAGGIGSEDLRPVDRHEDDHPQHGPGRGRESLPALERAAIDHQGARVVERRREHDQRQESDVPAAVEEVAGDEQHAVLPEVRQQPIQRVDRRQEEQVLE